MACEYTYTEESVRTVQLVGQEAAERLSAAHVAVFGIGGVGGHLCEALARVGVGHLTLVDRDVVSPSNINRQVVALQSTLGRPKVEVMAERIRDINPSCVVTAHQTFYLPETANEFDLSGFDYIADAVDTVAAKIELVVRANAVGVPIIAAMGAGNKLHPERFQISDIAKTTTDPLARIMRRELKARGIPHLTVVWSDESPLPLPASPDGSRPAPGSLSFVPSVMGLLMAGEIVRRLCGISNL